MEKNKIPFNRSCVGDEALDYIQQVFTKGTISGGGEFTTQCQNYFNKKLSAKTLLTNSCTAALEMAALLSDIIPGDEVIMPSFTFVSTANAFILRGAKIVFADTEDEYPNLDTLKIEELISKKTKAIIPVHYGGIACNMDKIMLLEKQYNLTIIEDAAQAIASYYKGKPLGTFGRFATFSFHETKNITSGEGGLLIINKEEDFHRAKIIWEKGTNRSDFHDEKVNKYEWVDIGSSFLPSDINAAILYSQIENLNIIQKKRIAIWNKYFEAFKSLQEKGKLLLPKIPDYGELNGHLFFLECESKKNRDDLIQHLKKNGIHAVFHYLPLHLSPFYKNKHDDRELKNTIKFSERIIRLPLFFDLKENEQEYIIDKVKEFY